MHLNTSIVVSYTKTYTIITRGTVLVIWMVASSSSSSYHWGSVLSVA